MRIWQQITVAQAVNAVHPGPFNQSDYCFGPCWNFARTFYIIEKKAHDLFYAVPRR